MKKSFLNILLKTFILTGIFVLLYFVFSDKSKRNNRIPDLDSIKKKKELVAVINQKEADKNNPKTNFSMEMAQAFADSLGVELKLIFEPDIKKAIKGLRRGKYHLIAHIMPVTTLYKNKLCFSIPIFRTHQVLVQGQKALDEKKAFINDQNDLANDTIHIQHNSPHKMRLQHLSEEIAASIHIVEMHDKTALELVEMVAHGEIKYTIYPRIFSQILQEEYPELDVSLNIGFTQNYAWAVHPDAVELLANVNDFLYNYIESNDYWELYRKYNRFTTETRRKPYSFQKTY